jgi:hypothetical protein
MVRFSPGACAPWVFVIDQLRRGRHGKMPMPIGWIRRECVDHSVVFGERHLRHALLSYMNYYNEVRTHRSLGKDASVHVQFMPSAGFFRGRFSAVSTTSTSRSDLRQGQVKLTLSSPFGRKPARRRHAIGARLRPECTRTTVPARCMGGTCRSDPVFRRACSPERIRAEYTYGSTTSLASQEPFSGLLLHSRHRRSCPSYHRQYDSAIRNDPAQLR